MKRLIDPIAIQQQQIITQMGHSEIRESFTQRTVPNLTLFL
jgi:hypothetical protein